MYSGRSVTDVNLQLIADAINDAFDAGVDPDFIINVSLETLKLEAEFNRQAGFDQADDELPEFFISQELPPTGKKARLHSAEVNNLMSEMIESRLTA